MTRKTWTTTEQEEWLKSQIQAFLKAHQNNTLKTFFPPIIKEFRDKWPVDPLSDQEIEASTSVEQAKKEKRDKYDKVNLLLLS